jgi:hypothetical protein
MVGGAAVMVEEGGMAQRNVQAPLAYASVMHMFRRFYLPLHASDPLPLSRIRRLNLAQTATQGRRWGLIAEDIMNRRRPGFLLPKDTLPSVTINHHEHGHSMLHHPEANISPNATSRIVPSESGLHHEISRLGND